MADTVLIVDDDAAVQTMLYKVIRSNGLESETASSGEEALELVKHRDYALILLDVNMHGMDGFEVVQRLRSRGTETEEKIRSETEKRRCPSSRAKITPEIGAPVASAKPAEAPPVIQ